jgi:hypothetical protein
VLSIAVFTKYAYLGVMNILPPNSPHNKTDLGSLVALNEQEKSIPYANKRHVLFPNASRANKGRQSSSPTSHQLVANRLSSSLRYSPQSACLKHVIPVGSNLRASCVLLAVTPKPRGVSFML